MKPDSVMHLAPSRVCAQVLMAYRNKDAQHVEWCKALKAVFLPGLKDYVKQHQTTGPAWKPNGIPVSQFKGEAPASTAPAAASRGPPPPPPKAPAPPPPPPAGSLLQPRAAAPAPASGMSALLQDLNKGDAVTSGEEIGGPVVARTRLGFLFMSLVAARRGPLLASLKLGRARVALDEVTSKAGRHMLHIPASHWKQSGPLIQSRWNKNTISIRRILRVNALES